MSLDKLAAKRKKAVIIKGNPYYLEQGPDTAGYRAYYKDIENELRNAGYGDVVYDKGESGTSPPPADLWVGHSRGASRLRFAPKGTKTLNITEYEDGINAYKAKLLREMHKRGYSSITEFPVEERPRPGREHYTLTQRGRAALRKQASAPRDYKREYKLFHSSPEAKRNRVKRNLWNRRLKGKVPAGHEIDHKRQLRNGGGNGRDNIRFMPISKNRAEHNRSKVMKDHMRKESAFKQKRYEVDRDKVRRETRKTNKRIAGGIGLLLGGLAGSKLGPIGIAGGAVGGGLIGAKAGTALRPSDKVIENIARAYEKEINQDRLSDLELAARGQSHYGGTLEGREALIRKFAKTASFNPHQWVYDSLIKSLVRT